MSASSRLPNPVVLAVDPYVPGEQPNDPEVIKLNTNEFPYPAAPEVIEEIRRAATDGIRKYPSPRCDALRAKLAQRHRVDPSQILIGNGSDEILRLAATAWGGAGRSVATVHPSYSLYPMLILASGASHVEFNLIDGERLPEPLFAAAPDLIMLPNPNPPIGTLFPHSEIERLAGCAGMLLIDEAYADFADNCDHVPLLESIPNLIVSRTFSKSYGLAGMRVGYAIASAETIGYMSRIADSYNVNRISQAAALAALEAGDYYSDRARAIREDRDWLSDRLIERGFVIPRSHGNFIFARHADAPGVFNALRAEKVFVRYFRQRGLENGIRITIGTREELDSLLAALDRIPATVSSGG